MGIIYMSAAHFIINVIRRIILLNDALTAECAYFV